ncbi:MAG TPA: hypothetical protein VNO70_13945 [Blastocatellia bacterium]|nr:hypothetical protein [Blastocatellia bacterium]
MSRHHYDPDHSTPDVSFIKNVDVAHEETDINVGTVFKFVGALAALIVVTMALMWLAMKYFAEREAEIERAAPPPTLLPEGSTKDKSVKQIFPEPRLQEHPQLDLQAYREAEKQLLDGYGWVDQGAGKVRIPIREAKKLVLERNLLPYTATPEAASVPEGETGQGQAAGQAPIVNTPREGQQGGAKAVQNPPNRGREQ